MAYIYFLYLPIIFLSDVLAVGLPMAVGGALGIGGSTISVSASSSLAQQPHSMGAGARFRGVSRRFEAFRGVFARRELLGLVFEPFQSCSCWSSETWSSCWLMASSCQRPEMEHAARMEESSLPWRCHSPCGKR